MTPITEISEALKLLNVVVERGGKIHTQMRNYAPKRFTLLIGAMVKGAEAVLKVVESWGPTYLDESVLAQQVIIKQANSYRPALEELGWWPK